MPPHALPERLAARLREEHVVRPHHLDHLFTRLQRDGRNPRDAERQRRQNQMMNLIGQRHLLMQFSNRSGERQRKPLQLDREDHEEQEPEPEDRYGDAQKGKSLNCLVQAAVTVHSREHAQNEADCARQRPRRHHQEKRKAKLFSDDFEYRGAIDERCAEITMQNIPRPKQEAFERRLVKAPVSGNKRVLLCRGRLVDEVCVNWING